jgi:hypothetical protein
MSSFSGNARTGSAPGSGHAVPAHARELAARLSALFEKDSLIVARLSSAQRRLRHANDRLCSGGAPDTFGATCDGTVAALAALREIHWQIHRAFCEYQSACEAFCERVNTREHRVTRRAPAVMLGEERERMHPLPKVPHTVCFGQTRKVDRQSTISVGSAIYSVPSELVEERVWARTHGSELIVVHVDSPEGPREVARHALTTPGRPSIKDEHYPPRPAGALQRTPRARSREEQAFLALGRGAEAWLIRAAAEGATRVRRKMAEAVDLAKLHGTGQVEHALEVCADAGRFGDGDLAAILAHQERSGTVIPFPARVSEEQSLQRSTRSWEGLGR